ncbi:hypothetical protein [uncultured Tenacibaculum sp.]|uniref:Cap15 family cyclic dinucleotide receptor domain-containing protein n=1 Tax=uncultured Tenacibaculum sp. TaxID=174713 RepID=UPI0026125764|nr:hypothetical protein [uncultured Tenacibaculum sp.]
MKPDFNFKYYDESKLILLVILLYVGSEALINLIINLLKAYNIEYHRFYPATILLGIIFWLINKKLHKIPFLWKLLIKVPLIRGTYKGNVKYNYQGVEGDKHCKLIIYQTTSDIKVDCYFWDEDKNGKKISSTQTKSESIVEDLIRKDNGLYQLLFYYQQKGSNDSSIPIRDGFNTLTLKEDGKLKRLEGGYFSKNSLSKGNGGTISVDFQTKELKHI